MKIGFTCLPLLHALMSAALSCSRRPLRNQTTLVADMPPLHNADTLCLHCCSIRICCSELYTVRYNKTVFALSSTPLPPRAAPPKQLTSLAGGLQAMIAPAGATGAHPRASIPVARAGTRRGGSSGWREKRGEQSGSRRARPQHHPIPPRALREHPAHAPTERVALGLPAWPPATPYWATRHRPVREDHMRMTCAGCLEDMARCPVECR